ncbi:MAG: type III-B CRISPR module RAMP protein Cmr6 [Candidatus Schekmanbacteria bacterium]|nr:type III-B CRISPR module RAMP protein Cmr6 [Candidatus Schekmanbacteria bacterium]
MRQVLQSVGTPDHVGLAYDAWAPVGEDGKVPDCDRASWLSALAAIAIPPEYSRSFERWKASFSAPGDRLFELVLASRLLVGHGNSSAIDLGITVHHTWGVPVIPGSALKGLVAHFVDTVYGPDDAALPPWEQPDTELARADYQGVTWRDRRVERGPGAVYRALFGAPEAGADEAMRAQGFDAGASSGLVMFHDALYVPNSGTDDSPFVADVLTVHQKAYYDGSGGSWPNDYDSPNPVAFLTVRPGARVLFALSGPADWTELTERLLIDALKKWGVGGKTSAGYGRFVTAEKGTASRGESSDPSRGTPNAARPRHQRGERITVRRVDDPTGKGKVKFRAADGFLGHFAEEAPPQVPIGEATEIWVANVSAQGYTLTLRQPKERRR